MDSIYIQQVARDYLFQLSQWEQSPPNPYYLFIYLFCLTILLLQLSSSDPSYKLDRNFLI